MEDKVRDYSYLDQTQVDREEPRTLVYGLWTLLRDGAQYDSGLPTGLCELDNLLSLRLLNPFFDNVLLEHGVHLAHKILETAQSPNSLFPIRIWDVDFGLGLGLRLVNTYLLLVNPSTNIRRNF